LTRKKDIFVQGSFEKGKEIIWSFVYNKQKRPCS